MYNENENRETENQEEKESQERIESSIDRPRRYVKDEDIYRSRRGAKKGYFLMALMGAVIGSLLTLSFAYVALPQILVDQGLLGQTPGQSITIEPLQDMTVYSAVTQKAMPSVVGITTVTLQRDAFFGTRRAQGLGTGVVVDERGYILTNSHVVGDGEVEEVMVLFYDGQTLPAEVLWNEKSLDLAIIQVEGSNFPVAELGNSDNLQVGELAIAIGNPLGLNLERTVTQGIISGLNRSLPTEQGQAIDNLIQTDASINPGNSGGPLLNAQGQVIGINTAKMRTAEGLGFSIPINTAKPIVDQFIEKGEFTRVYLGIRGLNVEEVEGMTGEVLQAEYGVYVFEIEANSPADQYDIRANDIIVGIGNQEVATMGQLIREIYRYRPGDEAIVHILRDGQEMSIKIGF
ncbi:2-alkenal reductase [Alkaliphilus metalliredigens QYMF]|uniref:2-alkenal reductase n=1 Tax=Alkaliphilus metalliredigens (strain QYMF) TaxID=293826 RepID=A6TX99_ALKMQ|nr:trypsin-like peptidase domain-containing protein [Alkaliphilus metalliredigens]ABR50817.1 2-alkenal reductase [Alkaliphilus metalliredigens QYMF]